MDNPPFLAAIILMPPLSAAGISLAVASAFGVPAKYWLGFFFYGGLIGLIALPFAILTVGTLGGGLWSNLGLPGGPLAGVIVTLSATCSMVAASTSAAALFTRRVLSRRKQRLAG